MPSKAYDVFRLSLLADVDALITAHKTLSTGNKGRQALGHITRSSLVLLCAAWEYYVEMVTCNIANYYGDKVSFEKLDNSVKSSLVSYLQDKNKGAMLVQCITHGWAKVLLQLVDSKAQILNTPKADRVIELFSIIGIDLNDFFNQEERKAKIDNFVSRRGETAHKGGEAKYPSIKYVKEHRNYIAELVQSLDDLITLELRAKYNKAPWQRISDAAKISRLV